MSAFVAAQPPESPVFEGHLDAVMMGVYTPDGTGVVTVSTDHTAKLWDIGTRQAVRTYAQHTAPVFSVAISGDGQTLVTGGQDNTVRVWNVPLREPVRTIADPGSGIRRMAMSGDGTTILAAGVDQKLRLHAAIAATPPMGVVRQGHSHPVSAVAWRNDGGQFASADEQGRILLWSPYVDGPQGELLSTPGRVAGLQFHSNNQQLYALSDDGRIRVWQMPVPTPQTLATAATEVANLAIVPGQSAALWANVDGTMRTTNLTSGAVILEYPKVPFRPTAVAISANGQWFATTGVGGLTELRSANDGSLRGVLQGHVGDVADVAIHPDSLRLATAGADGTVRLWTQPIPAVEVKGHTAPIRGIAAAANGGWFATISDDLSTRLWGADGAIQRTMANHEQPLRAIAVRDDDALLATGDAAGIVWVWNTANGAAEGYAAAHTGAIHSLMFSSDRNVLVTAGADGTVRAWTLPLPKQKPAEGEEPPKPVWEFKLPGNEVPLRMERLSAEQGFAVLGSVGTSIHRYQWDGIVRPAIPSPGRPLKTLAVTTDGVLLASVDDQGRAHVVDLEGKVKATVMLGAGTTSARFHQGQSELIVTDGKQRVRTASISTGRILEEIATSIPVSDAVAVGPELRQLAAVGTGNDGVVVGRSLVRMWETVTPLSEPASPTANGELAKLPAATTLVFHPDQQHLLCGADDGVIWQWNLTNGELVRRLIAHRHEADGQQPERPASLSDMIISPNGQLVVSVGADQMIRAFQLADGLPVAAIRLPAETRRLSMSPDNTRVAAAGDDGATRVYQFPGGELLQRFAGHTGGVRGVSFLSDNATIITGGVDKTLQLSKTSILRAYPVHESIVKDFILYAGGTHSLSTGADGQIVMADVNSGAVTRLFRVRQPMQESRGEGAVPVSAAAAGTEAATTGDAPVEPPPPTYMKLGPTVIANRGDNQRLAAGTEGGDLLCWNINNGDEPLSQWSLESPIVAIAFSPDNQKLAVATADKQVRIYGPSLPGVVPVSELTLHQQFAVAESVTGLNFASGSRSLWVSVSTGVLEEWRYASPGQLLQFNHGGPVYGVAVSQDGRTIVSCSSDQTVRVWDGTSGQQRFQMTGHVGAVHAVAMSHDETFAVSSGADGTLRLWDVVGGRQLKQLVKFDATMYSVAVHPSGKLIAAAGADRKVHLLDMITGAEQKTLEGHTDFINCVSFDSKGDRLLSYGYAGHLKIWSTADGKLLHESRVGKVGNYAQFSPKGDAVFISNGDGTARIVTVP
ncbi:MAG: hypothetical protein R3C01_03520 [Planctomycetaceae bacterium]